MEQSEVYRHREGQWRLKPLHWYGLVTSLLMVAAFIAGGIFLHSASAASIDKIKQHGAKCPATACGTSVLGYITAINGTTLQLKSWKDGSVITIKTTAQTEFVSKIAQRAITLSDLKVKDFIQATGQMDGVNNLVSRSIVVGIEPSSKAPEKKPTDGTSFLGYITAIHGSTLTVQSAGDKAMSSIHTITVSNTTELGSKLAGGKITLGELKTGDFIIAFGKSASNGNLRATTLVVGLTPSSQSVGK
ncbi:DUF5666 domain-containing protein [Dictyobacter formicarum]|uniref:DUF5666 domain-containing protein n=1 Tax=Dictyobacter formicarum TaxID=2778368 RepID=A0ABQ3VJX9_9CHLR|nr:DUF5666 domain-containing protein [Dictyobacter formicarum]GHO85971.1 hypothetical protein KSZ_39770 [Dictyobacter formicarum]